MDTIKEEHLSQDTLDFIKGLSALTEKALGILLEAARAFEVDLYTLGETIRIFKPHFSSVSRVLKRIAQLKLYELTDTSKHGGILLRIDISESDIYQVVLIKMLDKGPNEVYPVKNLTELKYAIELASRE
jgi:hypothetical protein